MIVTKNGTPIRTTTEWFQLAPPKRGAYHWTAGRSAYECADAWCTCPAGKHCPEEIADLLDSHPDTRGATFISATPEHCVRFDELRGSPRNADMVVLANRPEGLLAINIEAKADERFGDPVRNVLKASVNKIMAEKATDGVLRIQQLATALLVAPAPGTAALMDLQYQLLTGVAGAIAYAVEQGADRAIFIVHEFLTNQTNDARHKWNARNLDAFVARLTAGQVTSLRSGKLEGPFTIPGKPLFPNPPPLYIGKTQRNLRT